MESYLTTHDVHQISRVCDILFVFIPKYAILVCKECRYVVPRDMLHAHLNSKKAHRYRAPIARRIVREVDRRYPNVVTSASTIFTTRFCPPPTDEPLPYLLIHESYVGCSFDRQTDKLNVVGQQPLGEVCQHFARSPEVLMNHYRNKHGWNNPRKRGRPRRGCLEDGLPGTVVPCRTGVTCQQLRLCGSGSHFFEVKIATPGEEPIEVLKDSETLPMDLKQRLSRQIEVQQTRSTSPRKEGADDNRALHERSPWLEMTRWRSHFDGIRLSAVRPLISIPGPSSAAALSLDNEHTDVYINTILHQVAVALRELTIEAREVLTKDRINVFDQHRVNSFHRGRSFRRPIFTKLLDGTYRKYETVWIQFLVYSIRIGYFRQGPPIHFTMTETQALALDRLVSASHAIAHATGSDTGDIRSENATQAARKRLRRACLDFCIASLDHNLKGNIYDSILVGFIAALGIDARNERFREPSNFSSMLSGLIKLAQFFVSLRAVVGMDDGEVDFASDLLSDMQDRFMVFGSRSPIEWALKLRAYCRAVRDTTTVYGSIVWSEDGQQVSFKDAEIDIPQLRWFLRDQIQALRKSLEMLLFVGTDTGDRRDDIVPDLNIRSLKDDLSINTPGWSFLKDPRNTQLHGKEKDLLHRICDTSSLRKRFFKGDTTEQAKWHVPSVKEYFYQVIEFLTRLLLVIHITSGQPARSIELLMVQWRNSVEGYRRTIGLENGLVTLITTSIKGYTVDGSTRIIHRYLPPEVGELLIYYLLLVLPFCEQLQILAFHDAPDHMPMLLPSTPSSLLWSTQAGKPWPSDRLRAILSREFADQLSCPMNVLKWRHIAIAMSRKHISGKGFKRDYDNSIQIAADEQAGHSSLVAGTIYGRLIDAAPDFVQAAQAQYRDISLRWHRFLGFGIYLPARKNELVAIGGTRDTRVTDNESECKKRQGDSIEDVYKRAHEDLYRAIEQRSMYKKARPKR